VGMTGGWGGDDGVLSGIASVCGLMYAPHKFKSGAIHARISHT
jgi:hypothetical protein